MSGADRFPCPYLGADVELTAEREQHIVDEHPDLLPQYRERLAQTLLAPDGVKRSPRSGNARLFIKWFGSENAGRFVVVVVVSENQATARNWIVTAYFARRLGVGGFEWQKN